MLALGVAGCASLPGAVDRPPSKAFTDTADTRLGRALAALIAAHPGRTGVHALDNARDAFAARMLLARAAQRSVDVQYYIWRTDTSGAMLAGELLQAAERGVRVRLLLDDNTTRGMDEAMAALDAHPNIEVRRRRILRGRQPGGVRRPGRARGRRRVVVESAALAGRLSQALDREMRGIAYEVRLSPDGGSLEWLDGDIRYTSEPGAGLLKRLWIAFLSLLPIEWLL